MKNIRALWIASSSLLIFSCSNKVFQQTYTIDTPTEITQALGDSLAAMDEAGGLDSGDYTRADSDFSKTYARLNGESFPNAVLSKIFPMAEAGTCTTVAFTACDTTNFLKSRTLGSCSTLASGGALKGFIKMTYAGSGQSSCTLPASTDNVTRLANIEVSGLRGAVFGTGPTSTGQVLTRTGASTFTYTDNGTYRKFTDPTATQLLNLTTSTGTAISLSGSNRSGRTITAGTLNIVNNLNSVSCSFTPNTIAWGSSSCNCPTSGNLSSTCSDGTSMTVAFSSTCGVVTLTNNTDVSTITLDRCD